MRKKNWAVITIWDRACRLDNRIPNSNVGVETFERVNFFSTKKEAERYFKAEPQGQNEEAGEINRLLVIIADRN
jgi:hypothetical protein